MSAPVFSTWMSAGLQSLLRNALRHPGGMYQPLILENVPSGDSLAQALAMLAEAEGVELVRELDGMDPAHLPHRGVWLLAVNNLKFMPPLFYGMIPHEVQVVLWTTDLSAPIPDELESWIEGGLRYLATRTSSRTSRHQEVGSSLHLCLKEPGRVYNPLVFVCAEGEQDLLAIRALIRCEAFGVAPLLDLYGPFGLQGGVSAPAVQAGGGWVVRLRDYYPSNAQDEPFRKALGTALSAGVQVILIMDPGTAHRLSRHHIWEVLLSGGIQHTLVGAEALPKEMPPQTLLKEDAQWPSLREMLAGPPFRSESLGPPVFAGNVEDAGSLSFALQWPHMMRKSGRLVIYSPWEYGFVDFEQGWIVHAGPAERFFPLLDVAEAQGIDSSDTERFRVLAEQVVLDRICEMANWENSQFAFHSRTPQPPQVEMTHLSPEGVSFEIARVFDERPRLLVHAGGMGRVWVRIEEAPPADSATESAKRLWAALDGESTLGAVAKKLCMPSFEALEAADYLVRQHHIFIVHDLRWESPSLGTPDTILALWSEGMMLEAGLLLDRVIGKGDLSPHLLWLSAWTLVERGDWEEALQVFREVADSPLLAEAPLAEANATLIGLRLGHVTPTIALTTALRREWLQRAFQGQTDRLAALVAEVCIRAHRWDDAESLLAMISDVSVAQHLAQTLAQLRGDTPTI